MRPDPAPLPLLGIHHIELVVGNAKQAAFYYRKAFGFSQVAFAGPATGVREQASYVLRQGNIRLALSSPLYGDEAMAELLQKHGDFVIDVAFLVDDVDAVFREAMKRGAQEARAPYDRKDEHGKTRRAKIRGFGDTLHSFVSTREYRGEFLPRYRPVRKFTAGVGLLEIDCVAAGVEEGRLGDWGTYYHRVFGFRESAAGAVIKAGTPKRRMMADPGGKFQMPIVAPARGDSVDAYLAYNAGPGIQHVAFSCENLAYTASLLKENGVDFTLTTETRIPEFAGAAADLQAEASILRGLGATVERDAAGWFLKLETEPVEDRPTLHFEIVQRIDGDSPRYRPLLDAVA
ncbi:MAG TPA: VOC family protein [Planctomycetia bacterium]|nr:VOC family protein [Planctomycetia bacterium]